METIFRLDVLMEESEWSNANILSYCVIHQINAVLDMRFIGRRNKKIYDSYGRSFLRMFPGGKIFFRYYYPRRNTAGESMSLLRNLVYEEFRVLVLCRRKHVARIKKEAEVLKRQIYPGIPLEILPPRYELPAGNGIAIAQR